MLASRAEPTVNNAGRDIEIGGHEGNMGSDNERRDGRSVKDEKPDDGEARHGRDLFQVIQSLSAYLCSVEEE